MDESLKTAIDHMLQAANHLADYINSLSIDDDDTLYRATMNLLRERADLILPPGDGWPKGEGLGVIIPFVPRKRG